MKNFMILTESLDFIEKNLREPITRRDIADHCFVSLSMLEKLFRYALGYSIKEYIERRRMTLAAYDIAHRGLSVTEGAMKYQYNSVEVFSRSFRRVWNVSPSEFTERWKFTGIFPKINFRYKEGEEIYMARKRVDINEAYEYLLSRCGSYVLCFDGVHFMKFNEISRKAGDMAIIEMASRIDRAAGDDMQVMCIGGDEFALITGLYDEDKVVKLRDEILKRNGEPVIFGGRELPLSMWCGITKIPDNLHYDEFFTGLHKAIEDSKV